MTTSPAWSGRQVVLGNSALGGSARVAPRVEDRRDEYGARSAVVRYADGHIHLAEQRATPVDLSSLQTAGTAAPPSGVPSRRGRTTKGSPGKVVAQLMGHANVDTTLNVYTQVLDGSVAGRRRENRRRIVHDCSQAREGRCGN